MIVEEGHFRSKCFSWFVRIQRYAAILAISDCLLHWDDSVTIRIAD